MSRRTAKLLYGSHYSKPEGLDESSCFYCGAQADCVDHVPPLSVVDTLGVKLLVGTRLLLIPACTECNSKLGSLMLLDVKSRCQYLVGQYITACSPIAVDYDLDGSLRVITENAHRYAQSMETRVAYLWGVDSRLYLVEMVKPFESLPKSRTRAEAVAHVKMCREMGLKELVTTGKVAADEPDTPSACDAISLQGAIRAYYQKVNS